MAIAPLRISPWPFCTFRSLLRSWAFICSHQISLLHFSTGKLEQFCGFLHAFILVLNFSKALGFSQTFFVISARYLLISPLFLHLFQVLELSFSKQGQNLHHLLPCWFLKYYSDYLPVHCQFTAIIGMNTDSVIIFMFWLTTWPFLAFFPFLSLSSRGINLNILDFFSSVLPAPQAHFLILMTIQSLLSLALYLRDLGGSLSFNLVSARTFFYYFTNQILKLGHKCNRKKLKAII